MKFSLKNINWKAVSAVLGLIGLLAFQLAAFNYRLALSLGPVVLLQPKLQQNGWAIYENIADQHSPLMPILMQGLRAFSTDGLRNARLVLMGLIALITTLVFISARKVTNWGFALWASFFFVLWSPIFSFGKLWYETFLTPIYLLLFLIYDPSGRPRAGWKSFLIGLLLGIALLLKQHAAVVLLIWFGWNFYTVWVNGQSLRRFMIESVWTGVGAVAPFLVYMTYHYIQYGRLDNLIYWILIYTLSGQYTAATTKLPTPPQWAALFSSGMLLPAIPLLLLVRSLQKAPSARMIAWAVLMLIGAGITVYPTFLFYHLQGYLAFLAVIYGMILYQAYAKTGRWFSLAICLSLSIYWVLTFGWAGYQPLLETNTPRYLWEYSNLVPLSAEVRNRLGPDVCFYNFPDDEATSNLYYLTGCPPPSFYIFHYPGYSAEPIKSWIMADVLAHPPDNILYFPARWEFYKRYPELQAWIDANYRQTDTLPWDGGEVRLLRRVR
jgi:hypothetical protein